MRVGDQIDQVDKYLKGYETNSQKIHLALMIIMDIIKEFSFRWKPADFTNVFMAISAKIISTGFPSSSQFPWYISWAFGIPVYFEIEGTTYQKETHLRLETLPLGKQAQPGPVNPSKVLLVINGTSSLRLSLLTTTGFVFIDDTDIIHIDIWWFYWWYIEKIGSWITI